MQEKMKNDTAGEIINDFIRYNGRGLRYCSLWWYSSRIRARVVRLNLDEEGDTGRLQEPNSTCFECNPGD